MRLKSTFLIMIFCAVSVFAQYPTVSISDLNRIDDATLQTINDIAALNSPYSDNGSPGDTVTVRGVVLFAPMVDWENDRRLTTSSGKYGNFVTWLQSENGDLWGGLMLIQEDTLYQTGFDIIDSGDVIEVTGVISEGRYGNTTTMDVLVDPLTEINVLDNIGGRPDPIIVSFDEFFEGSSEKMEAEKYESMYVEFNNVIVNNSSPGSSTNFSFTDGSGNTIFMYDQSSYFTERIESRLTGLTTYESPAEGTLLEHIRGIIHTRSDGWYIVPLYPGDIKYGTTAPATIRLAKDSDARVMPNEETTVKFKISDIDGIVESATLSYKMEDESSYTNIDMQFDDTSYVATIPGINSDSTMVQYYVTAVDDSGNVSTSPNNPEKESYYYWVLKNDPSIYHLQYTPYRGGDSRFDGEEVTITAILTADTSDNRFNQYIQDPVGNQWAGIRLRKVPNNGQVRGDMVTVTGTVVEDYYVTTIDVSDLTIVSSGNELPAPVVLPTSTIATGRNDAAEEYEGMIVRYENVTVIDENADGPNNNYGEIYVDDGSGHTRVELQEGFNNYHNNWDPSLEDSTGMIRVVENSEFSSITGVLYYSFSNWKLLPRQDDDFVGFTGIKTLNEIPQDFSLNQNYPNPFNPTTVIEFSLVNTGMTNLTIYNAIGEEITSLVKEMKNAGTYRVNFNASNLPSGVYFYKLQSGTNVQVKKMMLIK